MLRVTRVTARRTHLAPADVDRDIPERRADRRAGYSNRRAAAVAQRAEQHLAVDFRRRIAGVIRRSLGRPLSHDRQRHWSTRDAALSLSARVIPIRTDAT